MSPLIGILGCGGAVGAVACDILRRSFRIRGGQRNRPGTKGRYLGCEWVSLDLYDQSSLMDFCKGCDVILNCAGPSCRIGDRVALAAMKAGAGYVDVFGAGALEQSFASIGDSAGGIFVIAAGVFPGLSGVLPLWLSRQKFDTIESVYGFAGGREYVSVGAAADLLLSAVEGFGIPDAYWAGGAVCRQPHAFPNPVQLPAFKGDVYVQQFINNEMIRLAELLLLNEAHWHSIYTDKQIADAISRGCSLLSADNNDIVLGQSVNELVTLAERLLEGRSPWYTMITEMQGMIRGKLKRKRVILRSTDSYRLSGIVAAETVRQILQHPLSDGVYWAFEILNPDRTIARIQEENAANIWDILDVPPEISHEPARQIYEGIL